MKRVYLSRQINYYLLGGKREMVCSRAYREKWLVTVKVMDTIFFWDKQHCRKCYLLEVMNGNQLYLVQD